MSDRITKERIQKRLAELKEGERQATAQVLAFRAAIGELEALLKPDEPQLSGEPLGTQEA